MLTDPVEIEIISKARQKNVADSRRSREHFNRIFEGFLRRVEFSKTRVIDLGPGQYDFGVLAKKRGAEVWAVDNDPAVIKLGRYKGFSVVERNLQQLKTKDFESKFDGVFCKFSLNSFWFWEDENKLKDHICNVTHLIHERGWGWIAPWNGIPKKQKISKEQIEHILQIQKEIFLDNGFMSYEITKEMAKYYGVQGAVANHIIFTKNTDCPQDLV